MPRVYKDVRVHLQNAGADRYEGGRYERALPIIAESEQAIGLSHLTVVGKATKADFCDGLHPSFGHRLHIDAVRFNQPENFQQGGLPLRRKGNEINYQIMDLYFIFASILFVWPN